MTSSALAPTIVVEPPDDLAAGVPPRSRRRRVATRQLGRFLAVGIVCTAFFTALYLVLKNPVGSEAANTIALVLAAVLNTALNRRHTFGVRGNAGAMGHHAKGLVILALNWALSTGALMGLRLLVPTATRVSEVVVLTVANLVATALRFILMRRWVFPG